MDLARQQARSAVRVLVCGGRDFDDQAIVYRGLDLFHGKQMISLVIHGKQRGVDTLAGRWARLNGIDELPFSADEDFAKWGARGGSIRNGRMLRVGKPSVVLAFPGGPGTRNMIGQATLAGLPILRFLTIRGHVTCYTWSCASGELAGTR
jgi:hypothetical protein